MMKSEAYINKIIEDTGLQRKEIQELVEEKKQELKGLISEEGALFIIAKELGVDIKEESKDLMEDIEIKIIDISPNMKNITLIGRIKDIYNVFTFEREDGNKGKVGSFLLHDDTGDIRIVLWNDQADVLESQTFDINELVKIINGFAKEGKDKNIEIHVSRLGKLILSPNDVDYKKFPKIKHQVISISEVNESMHSVSVKGKIMNIFPIKEFEKKNGELGKVGSMILADSTGLIRITFWNEDTQKLDSLNPNDHVQITHLKPRLNKLDSNKIDLHGSSYSKITKLDEDINLADQFVEKIKMLQKSQKIVSIKGVITSIDNLKKISAKNGEEISLLSFNISDETDWIRVTLWREPAEKYSEVLNAGDAICLKNVMVKYNNYSKRNEISFVNNSEINKTELNLDNLKIPEASNETGGKPRFSRNYTKIKNINSSDFLEIKGFIAKEIKNNDLIIYDACSNCRKKSENCTCEGEHPIIKNMILKIVIDDGSDTIRTTFFGEKAEELIGLKAEDISTIVDIDNFLENLSKELMGRDVIIRGKSIYNDYNELNRYEMNVYDYKDLDVSKELEIKMNELESL
ncbi:MAG: DUF2240 family protein [Promethearchaeota archaeon]|nr:MAG: DUF2240 family protein [Candidatus Lokiarchaeota archaeon]